MDLLSVTCPFDIYVQFMPCVYGILWNLNESTWNTLPVLIVGLGRGGGGFQFGNEVDPKKCRNRSFALLGTQPVKCGIGC